jgi:hypothetical protein
MEMTQMENSIKVIKQIEATHKGLGVPTQFGNVCVTAGISQLYVGEVGTGKGTAIRSITNPFLSAYDMNLNSVTLTELVHRIGHVQSETLVWRFPEWSTLSKYHRELFLTVGSQIISDHNYYHEMGEKKGVPTVIDIKSCDLIAIIGIQPLKMAKMMKENENWESLASDRFIKFAMFNPLREDTIESTPKYNMVKYKYEPKMEITTEMTLTRRLLNAQISEERLPLFCRHLLRGYATVEGKERVTIREEVEFIKLFKPYLEIYPSMIYTSDIEEEKTFASGAYRLFLLISKHEGATIEEIRDKFRVYTKHIRTGRFATEAYDKMIMRHAELLMDMGWIFMNHNSPTKFYLSDKLHQYFDWYRDNLQ